MNSGDRKLVRRNIILSLLAWKMDVLYWLFKCFKSAYIHLLCKLLTFVNDSSHSTIALLCISNKVIHILDDARNLICHKARVTSCLFTLFDFIFCLLIDECVGKVWFRLVHIFCVLICDSLHISSLIYCYFKAREFWVFHIAIHTYCYGYWIYSIQAYFEFSFG